jgi:hypothetical protein
MRPSVVQLAAPALLGLALAQGAAAASVCSGATSISEFHLAVQPSAGKPLIALRDAHTFGAGFRLVYTPGPLASEAGKNAEVAVVLVPINKGGVQKRTVTVLEPQSALKNAEWESPVAVEVAALVYGPQGLDKSRVKKLVEKDAELISQLADYAEKTAQAESLMEQLKISNAGASGPTTSIDAAVKGISSAPSAPAAVDRSAPTNQQLNSVLQGLNPAVANYDPLATSQSAKVAQTAGAAARIAGMFFNNTVGVAVGSAALAENLRAMMFPNMDFRSTFAQSSPDGTQTLCAKREAQQARTKLAYLWAMHVPNTPMPNVKIKGVAYLPQGGDGKVALDLLQETSWKSLGSVKQWRLAPASGTAAEVPATVDQKEQAVKIDLAHTTVTPGEYSLSAVWDWDSFTAAGRVQVIAPPDLAKAAIEPASSDKLVHGTGTVEVKLTGADFQFVDAAKLESTKPDAKPVELTIKLPKGRGAGPQESILVSVNSGTLAAGEYKLALSQAGGKPVEIPLRILPPAPVLTGLPLRVNLGETEQTVTLKGSGLDRIEALSNAVAKIDLAASTEAAQRKATVHLAAGAKAGQDLELQMKVEGVNAPQTVKAALHIAPARPKITAATMSRAQSLGIELKSDELPADTYVTYSIRVQNADGPSVVRIACLDSTQTLAAQDLRPGEKSAAARVDRAGAGGVFLSLMPGAVGQPGCELTARVENAAGTSDGYKLGRIARLPKIEKFSVSDEKVGDAKYAATLEGEHLEGITMVGWDAEHGTPVDGLPVPVAGDSQRQTMKISVTWPSPSPRAPLYVWLQGEDKGRQTESRY